eukprot:Nk52_evm13s805 gene=Nk52_evmTU13s805
MLSLFILGDSSAPIVDFYRCKCDCPGNTTVVNVYSDEECRCTIVLPELTSGECQNCICNGEEDSNSLFIMSMVYLWILITASLLVFLVLRKICTSNDQSVSSGRRSSLASTSSSRRQVDRRRWYTRLFGRCTGGGSDDRYGAIEYEELSFDESDSDFADDNDSDEAERFNLPSSTLRDTSE